MLSFPLLFCECTEIISQYIIYNQAVTKQKRRFCIPAVILSVAKKLCVSILTLFALILTHSLSAQNLIPNPSIEIFYQDSCPTEQGTRDTPQLQKATPWYSPTKSTPDLFNECANPSPSGAVIGVPQNFCGYQQPKSGKGYAGFYATTFYENYKEYVQVPLLSSLQPNTQYYLSFHLSLSDSSLYATDDIGAYFSKEKIVRNGDGPLGHDDTLTYIPQITNPEGKNLTDKINWMEIKGSFSAAGGESYLTIGCFKADVDMDTLLVPNGSYAYGLNIYYYIDSISLCTFPNGCDTITKKDEISIKKQPKINYNNYLKNITIDLENEQNNKIEIYNSFGELKEQILSTENNIIINTETWNKGVYFIKIYNEKNSFLHKFIIF